MVNFGLTVFYFLGLPVSAFGTSLFSIIFAQLGLFYNPFNFGSISISSKVIKKRCQIESKT